MMLKSVRILLERSREKMAEIILERTGMNGTDGIPYNSQLY